MPISKFLEEQIKKLSASTAAKIKTKIRPYFQDFIFGRRGRGGRDFEKIQDNKPSYFLEQQHGKLPILVKKSLQSVPWLT